MKTMRIVNEGLSGCKVRAGGMLFQDAGGCWHAHVPSLGLSGYGWTRQAAFVSLEVVCGVYLRMVWGRDGLLDEIREKGWEEEEGTWYAPVVPFGQLREMVSYMQEGAVMRPFGLCLEAESARRGASV